MSPFPIQRLRRLRENPRVRDLVRETELLHRNLVQPLFVVPGKKIKNAVASMPEVFQFSMDELLREIEGLVSLGLPAVILFGVPDKKDARASEAYRENNFLIQTIGALKKEYPDLLVIADVCLCEYTDHGHCGVVKKEGKKFWVENDATLELLSKMAGACARAGADVIAPSDMMDGRVAKIRDELDASGFTHLPILSYAVKYASAFYGPFREAARSVPQFGDRRSYQMDMGNAREAIREASLDLEEGADMLLVKPALPCLDILSRLRQNFPVPLAAYQVSGEYAMIKAVAAQRSMDEKAIVLESLTAIKRAGADFIITYFAKDAARYLRDNF